MASRAWRRRTWWDLRMSADLTTQDWTAGGIAAEVGARRATAVDTVGESLRRLAGLREMQVVAAS